MNLLLKLSTNFRMNSELKTILKLLGNFENEFTPETIYKLSNEF
jgi:hypothetical protein